ncbi:MAG: carboxypeptidase regulatory-like domain-containing protein [Acidobacteriia bacterium]|nr:carboxypeptidase regulatory-like domain-containing protein [Terriglobia bacterium]
MNSSLVKLLTLFPGGAAKSSRARTESWLLSLGFLFLWLLAGLSAPAFGQGLSSGTIRGSVLDPSGAAIKGATVEIRNPVTGYTRTIETDDQGNFELTNVPYNPYHLGVTAPGFALNQQDVDVRTPVPIDLRIGLKLGTETTTVTVQAEASDLLETTPTAHTDVGQQLIQSLPVQNQSTGFAELVTNAAPAVAADANGFYHPLGEHADTEIVLDNQPIPDQQSKIFSNQLALNTVQSFELVTGAPPAEYGDRTSLIINTSSRSGLGQKKPTGDLSAEYGSFGSWAELFDIGWGGDKWGNFLAVDTNGSSRFLDAPEFTNLHDKGNAETIFDHFDLRPTERDTLHLNLSAQRSWFQQPNTFDQQATGQDQRSQIRSTNIAPGFTHLFGQNLLLTFNPYYRLDEFQFFPSRDPFWDTPATARQTRRLNNIGARADLSYSHGRHEIKGGLQLNHWLLTESFNLGLTDPTFNPVCLNPDGSPDINPTPTDPAACAPLGVQPNPNLAPGLIPYDLMRGGSLFTFDGHADIKELSAYVQDSIKLGNWLVKAGVRGDHYNGLTRARQIEPRFAVSYHLPSTNTVLRASYARLLLAPFNEGLLLGSSTGAGGLASAGFGGFGASPIVSQRRNQFNTGFEQTIGRFLVVDWEYFWKFSSRGSDFDTLFSTPIVFPTLWRKSKIDGFGIRASLPTIKGFTAYTVMGHARSRYFGPEVGGLIFNSPLATGAFRIDHDQAFQQTTNLRYQYKKGSYAILTWRYDSGLVAGSVPDLASALALSADEQAVIGLHCGSAFATLTNPITSCSLPYPQFSATRVRIPAAGTENDDTNPPRITPRHLFDASVGTDNLFHTDRYRMALRLSVLNLTNKQALYNFLSTFSGTHVVTPRTYQASLSLTF